MTGDQDPQLGRVGVALLGPGIEHRDSIRAMLEGRAGRLICLPDSPSFSKGQGGGPGRKLRRLLDQFRGTRNPDYLASILKTLDESESRLVIGFWGTLPLPDLVAVKKARPHLKLVLMVLCYPLALTALGIARQNLFMRRGLRFLDGVMYPSEEMAGYFRDRVFGRHAPPAVVIPPCWPAGFQPATRPQSLGDRPNLVYVGRTDLAGSTIHAADDIRPLMGAILESGIELHHCYSPETDDGHPNRKPFRHLSLPDLVKTMSRFDASLIAYNTAACSRDDRFRLTVPDRLITSAAAGVPVAVPARGYTASKSYLREYPAVVEFDSPGELRDALADRPRVAGLRDAAWAARPNYAAERHAPALGAFLRRLL
jgi:hypothetical protein